MCSDLDNDILGEMSEDEAYMLAKETGEAGNEDDDACLVPTDTPKAIKHGVLRRRSRQSSKKL